MLSGSRRLGLDARVQRWPYGKCARVLVPSEATRAALIAREASRPSGSDLDARRRYRVLHRRGDRRRCARNGASRRHARRCSMSAACRARRGSTCCRRCAQACTIGIAHRFISPATGRSARAAERLSRRGVHRRAAARRGGRGCSRRPTCSCFRAAPTRLATSCSKRRRSGLPVLVSDEGGPRENMIDGDTGLIVRAGPTARAWANSPLRTTCCATSGAAPAWPRRRGATRNRAHGSRRSSRSIARSARCRRVSHDVAAAGSRDGSGQRPRRRDGASLS